MYVSFLLDEGKSLNVFNDLPYVNNNQLEQVPSRNNFILP